MVFGGDFCQTLPVVPKGTRQQVVAASLCRGNLWGHIKFLHLRQNIRLGHSEADNQHAQWLLEIGARSTMCHRLHLVISPPILRRFPRS